MTREYPYTPILGWSGSRSHTFHTCKRRYYYQYYDKFDPDHPRDRIDHLKRLVTRALAVGSVTHDVIKTLLERLRTSRERIDLDRLQAYVETTTETYCHDHRFAEVYYRELRAIDCAAIAWSVQTCLENLLTSHRFAWLLEEAAPYRDRWLVDPPGYGETRMLGMKAYCVPDFLSPSSEGLVIIDWKTGAPSFAKDARQVAAYATWATLEYETDPSQVKPFVAYLSPRYDERHVPFRSLEVEAFLNRFRKETEEMYGYCRDVDRNLPRDKEAFEMTENRASCRYCNFRELCDR